MSPKFSIVVPLYNKQEAVGDCISSCINQEFKDFEIIVVNDGSTDKSAEIVEDLFGDKVKLVNQENGGPSAARNKGVSEATGEWIVYLDADDTLLPDALTTFSKLLSRHPDVKVFCCNFYSERKGQRSLYSSKYNNGIVSDNFRAWLTKRLMPRAGATALRKDVALQYRFDEQIRRYEDAKMLFEIFRHERIVTCPIPVLVNRTDYCAASKLRSNCAEDFVCSVQLGGGELWEEVAKYFLYVNRKLYGLPISRKLGLEIGVFVTKLLSRL